MWAGQAVAIRHLAAGEARVIMGLVALPFKNGELHREGHGGLTPVDECQESLGAVFGSLATVRNDRFDQK
jgi:hypothetical protein